MKRSLWPLACLAVAALLAGTDPGEAQVVKGAAYNPYTGRGASRTAAYNPATGTSAKSRSGYNAYTGNYAKTTTAYNPYTGNSANRTVTYNPYTGNGSASYSRQTSGKVRVVTPQ
jgi:hypothetical protein